MLNSIRYVLITIALFMLSKPAMASHLAGQDLTYVYLGDSAGLNHYRVTLDIYQDCINGNPGAIAADNPAFIGVFDAGTGSVIATDSVYYSSSISVPVTVFGPCDSGGTIIPMCILEKVFVKDYYLLPSTTGYVISYQRCCFVASLVNLVDAGNQGITSTCNIPPSTVALTNNSAIFTNYPPFVIPINYPLTFDGSATDPDGDSLSYEICSALASNAAALSPTASPTAPPYDSVAYLFPLNYSNPMNCTVPLAIDPVTGLMTATPDALGRYLITVCCHEWRGGAAISTIHRDFEFIVSSCPLPPPDTIIASVTVQGTFPNPATTTLTISATEDIHEIEVADIYGNKFVLPWTSAIALGGKQDAQEIYIDTSLLPSGMYFVKVNNSGITKFLKQGN